MSRGGEEVSFLPSWLERRQHRARTHPFKITSLFKGSEAYPEAATIAAENNEFMDEHPEGPEGLDEEDSEEMDE